MQGDPSRESGRLEARSAQWRLALYIVWTLIGIAILAYFSGSVLEILSIPVGIIVLTTILVFCLRGPADNLARKGVPRGLAVACAFVLLFVALFVLGMLAKPVFATGGGLDSLLAGFSSAIAAVQGFIESLYANYPQVFSDPTVMSWIDSSLASLVTYAERAISGLAQNMLSVAGFTVNALMCIMFALVASFWLLLEMPRMRGEASRLFGARITEDLSFLDSVFSRVLGGFVKGTLVQCIVIGVGCGIAYTLIGFHDASVFAFIVAVCNVLPVLGQWVGLAVIAVATLFGDTVTAVLVVVATLLIQRIVYMFIYPKIMADSVDVHPVLIIISMMVGYALGGALTGVTGSLVGVFVSIPLAAVAKAMFVYYFEKRTGRHLVAEDGVFFKGVPNSDEVPDPHHNATSPHPAAYAKKQAAATRKAGKGAAAAERGSRSAQQPEGRDPSCAEAPSHAEPPGVCGKGPKEVK